MAGWRVALGGVRMRSLWPVAFGPPRFNLRRTKSAVSSRPSCHSCRQGVEPQCNTELTPRRGGGLERAVRPRCVNMSGRSARRALYDTSSTPPLKHGARGIKTDGTRIRENPASRRKKKRKFFFFFFFGKPGHRSIGTGSCRSARADGVERRSTAVVRGRSPALDGGPRDPSARRQHSGPSSIRLFSHGR
jgi:hypothetical protein